MNESAGDVLHERLTQPVRSTTRNHEGLDGRSSFVRQRVDVNLRVAAHRHHDVEHRQRTAMCLALRVANSTHHCMSVDTRVVRLKHELNSHKKLSLLFLGLADAWREEAREEAREEPSDEQPPSPQ